MAQTIEYIGINGGYLYKKAASLQKNLPSNTGAGKQGRRKFKVLQLCTQDFGGAGKASYRLHKSLIQLGVDSTMLVMRKRSRDSSVKVMPDEFDGNPVSSLNIGQFESRSYFKQARRWQNVLAGYPNRPQDREVFSDALSDMRLELMRDVQEADIIHLHWVAGLFDALNAPLSLKGKPIVWTLHDMNPFTGGCHYAGSCQNYLNTCGRCPQLGSDYEDDFAKEIWTHKQYAYQSLRINPVCPSRWLGRCAMQSKLFSKFNIRVIANGFPLDVFKSYPKPEVRRALHLPESLRIVLFGADALTNKRKGFQYLIEALNRLSSLNRHDNIALITFGNLPKGIEIASKYPVYSLGYINDESRIAQIYNAADVFVIPSLEDNLPNTAVEAISCGTPVVGFDIGGISEIVAHKETGYLVNPEDASDLAEGIGWVLSANTSTATFSMNCRQTAVKQFDGSTQAAAYMELYQQIIDESVRSDRSFKVSGSSVG